MMFASMWFKELPRNIKMEKLIISNLKFKDLLLPQESDEKP